MRFNISYNRFNLPLLTLLGMGPRRAGVEIVDDVITVRMGWAFVARIPLRYVSTAVVSKRLVLGWGVHGWRGRWLVNGSSQGIVAITVDPPVAGRAVGVPIKLRQLYVSLENPSSFLAACGVTTAA